MMREMANATSLSPSRLVWSDGHRLRHRLQLDQDRSRNSVLLHMMAVVPAALAVAAVLALAACAFGMLTCRRRLRIRPSQGASMS